MASLSSLIAAPLSLFLHFPLCFLSSFAPRPSSSFPSLRPAPLLVLQPSSPGDYYGSVDGDLKVELTEKLFALDTEGNNGPANTEVCLLHVNTALHQKDTVILWIEVDFSNIDSSYKATKSPPPSPRPPQCPVKTFINIIFLCLCPKNTHILTKLKEF